MVISFKKNSSNQMANALIESLLFDLDFYSKQSGKVFSSKAAAVQSYLSAWAAGESVKASPFFDEEFYLTKYPDIKAANVNPLLHYIEFGAKERRQPSALFYPEFFLSQLGEAVRAEIDDPLTFYIEHPLVGRPCALFDGEFYSQGIDLNSEHPLAHYLSIGSKDPHPLFNEAYIRSQHTIPSGESVLEWYMDNEDKNSIQCNRYFDTQFYLQLHSELVGSSFDALSHYIVVGSGNQAWPCKLFWPHHYENQANKDEIKEYGSALGHYIHVGEAKGLSPNPWFDPAFYLETYGWVRSDDRGPLIHYIEDGWKHDLLPSEIFSPKYVRQHYEMDKNANPVELYLLNHAGKPTLPQKAWFDPVDETEQRRVVKEALTHEPVIDPVVSVVVPVYNNFSYTLRCVYSILIAQDETPIEIIIADDQSSDETEAFFSPLAGLTYIRNPENFGFLLSCNNAAKSAKGEYLFLLNNDTAVLDGWVDRLVETFDNEPKAGLVGSKLLYPNGLLQEAGGILWSDGAANYGKFDDPQRPEYSYLREVDYVSGAAIMTPMVLWRELGGFDERYVPAYCEDSDFCLSVRDKGLKVMMQPASQIVHFEGISNGTDINSGIKKYQVENSKKLSEKWDKLLSSNGVSGDFSRECVDRSVGPRLLIIDATVPTPDQDAGSVTQWYFLKIFRQLGYQITFLPENLLYTSHYTENIQALGVEVIYAPYYKSVERFLEEEGAQYDAVMLYRVPNGGRFYEHVRKFAPQAKIIFDTVDLHFLREERQAAMEKDKEEKARLLQQAAETKTRELYLLKHSDMSIVLSDYEKQMLRRDHGIRNTFVVPIVLEAPGSKTPFADRRDIAFIGGYQHTPNIDAVLYFADKIWPQVKESIPGIKFYVVGSKPPAEVLELQEQDDDIVVTGFVENLDPIFERIRVTVAPLRFGAGIKGKIGTSMSYGVPCIATKIAAEGMGLSDGCNVYMSSEDSEMIEKIVEVYSSRQLWELLSMNAISFIKDQYSVEVIGKKIEYLFKSIGIQSLITNTDYK